MSFINSGEIEEEQKDRQKRDKDFYDTLMALQYEQVIRLFVHTQNYTVFSTKHGTKGEEYRNVLAILDDTDWKQEYNFNGYFDDTDDNPARKLMTKNLFYVTCSRSEENLVVLMLSPLSIESLGVIKYWFGEDRVVDVEEYLRGDE
jgi:DNA helicase-2/ATP-dependent DNA helicase PcrA